MRMKSGQRARLLGLAGGALLTACLGSPISAYALEGSVTLEDGADLLTDEEEESLTGLSWELADEAGWDVMLVTAQDAQGKTAQTYAEDFFLANNQQEDGVVYLIDMDNRELYVATSGAAVHFLTDERVESLLDDAYEQVSDQQYADAFRVMLEDSQADFAAGIPDDHTIYNSDTGEVTRYVPPKKITALEGVIALIAALAAGGIFFASVTARYAMKSGNYRYAWKENSEIKLTGRKDQFVNRFITRRHIPKDPPDGGGSDSGQSTVHSGSDGHTFGGGGRSF